ncbi:uncharacterized protein TNCV_3865541 [Trichonephila clavipes]|nr:uncharacterized protein TNCV_3865541 [Trichonephila clavipes]
MAPRCVARGCNSGKCERTCLTVSHYRFPLRNPILLKIWLRKINRKNFKPTTRSRLCSDHFEENCFVYIGPERTNIRKILKRNSIPTKFLKWEQRPPRRVFDTCLKACDLSSSQTSSDFSSSPTPSDLSPSPTPSDLGPCQTPSDLGPCLEPSGLNPFLEPSGLNPFLEPSDLNPFLEPSDLNPFLEPSDLNPFLEPSDLNPFLEPSDLNPFLEPSDSGPLLEPSDSIALLESTDSIALLEPSDSIALLEPSDSGPLLEPSDSGPLLKPSDSCPLLKPSDSCPLLKPSDSNFLLEPSDSGPLLEPSDSGPLLEPSNSGPLLEPSNSGPLLEPSNSGPLLEPSDSGPLLEPSNSGPLLEPSNSGPLLEPSGSGPFLEPSDSNIEDITLKNAIFSKTSSNPEEHSEKLFSKWQQTMDGFKKAFTEMFDKEKLIPENVPDDRTLERVLECMPLLFRHEYQDVRIIIDHVSFEIEKPKIEDEDKITFCPQRKTNIVKGMVAMMPSGAIIFVTLLYCGSISDEHIFVHSKVMDYLEPNDVVIAENGFQVEKELKKIGCELKNRNYLEDKIVFDSTADHPVLTKLTLKKNMSNRMVHWALNLVECNAVWELPTYSC